MIKYDYIFVDLDGTILDNQYRHYQCYSDIVSLYGGCPIDINTYWFLKRSKKDMDYILNISKFKAEKRIFTKEWLIRIETKDYLIYDKLKPQVIIALNKLKEKTKEICLLTLRTKQENLIWQLKKLKIYDIFDTVISGKYVSDISKYEMIKNYTYNRALVIGDTEIDIKTAKLANCEFIGIRNGIRNKDIFINEVSYNEIIDAINDI